MKKKGKMSGEGRFLFFNSSILFSKGNGRGRKILILIFFSTLIFSDALVFYLFFHVSFRK